jgi:tight adherence protein C
MAAGYAGQPLNLKMILPAGMSADGLYIGLSTLVAVGCAWALARNFGPRRKMTHRIKAIQERRAQLYGELQGPRRRKSHTPESSVNFMRAVANKLQLVKNLQLEKAETMLVEAGFNSKDAVSVMAFFVMALPIVFGVIGFVVMRINAEHPGRWHFFNLMWPVGGLYLGMKLPWMYVRRKRKKRYLRIQRSLADVLDLMTICAEAGLSLAAALERVSRELRISYPDMAQELGLTAVELGFLPDRNKALANLAERCQLPEIKGIVSVLIQTEKYGTPIAQALRVLSAEFRQSRMLRAEQKAAQLPALMTIPMIVFILPVLFIVIIAPAAVKLMDTIAATH